MNQSEKALIREMIEKHQKSQSTLIKHFRSDLKSAERFRIRNEDDMVEWCEEKARKNLRMARIHQETIKDLALLIEVDTVKFQDEIFLKDQLIITSAGTFVKDTDKPITSHERITCSRDQI